VAEHAGEFAEDGMLQPNEALAALVGLGLDGHAAERKCGFGL